MSVEPPAPMTNRNMTTIKHWQNPVCTQHPLYERPKYLEALLYIAVGHEQY